MASKTRRASSSNNFKKVIGSKYPRVSNNHRNALASWASKIKSGNTKNLSFRNNIQPHLSNNITENNFNKLLDMNVNEDPIHVNVPNVPTNTVNANYPIDPLVSTPTVNANYPNVPNVVTPNVVTPNVVTPKVVTPKVVTPKVVTPNVVTPKVVNNTRTSYQKYMNEFGKNAVKTQQTKPKNKTKPRWFTPRRKSRKSRKSRR